VRKPKPHKFPKASFTPSIIPEAALAQCAVLGSTAGPRGELARELLQRHPYIMAQKLFVAGLLLSGQAAALAATDGDFIGECFYQHKNAREEAARIVRDVWSLELVANMTSGRTI
jgi:hypothetical protein